MCESGEDQTNEDERHSLFGHTPAPAHLKSRHLFCQMHNQWCTNWRARLREKSHFDIGLLTGDLAKGHNSPGSPGEASIDRKLDTLAVKNNGRNENTMMETQRVCGLATENMAQLLQCSLLTHPCTLDALLEFNDTGRECAERWKKTV